MNLMRTKHSSLSYIQRKFANQKRTNNHYNLYLRLVPYMSSSLESLAVKSSRVSSHSAKFESSRESPTKVTRVRLESLPVTRVNNSDKGSKLGGSVLGTFPYVNYVRP